MAAWNSAACFQQGGLTINHLCRSEYPCPCVAICTKCNIFYALQEDIIYRFCNTIGIQSVDYGINNFKRRWKSVKHNSNNINSDVKSYIRATCFDSTESSSGPPVSDPYKERTTHCGIPNAYNKNKITKLQN